MAYNFSRRDFMKCAGVTVLAVAAGGLLAGCAGGGNNGGNTIPSKTDAKFTTNEKGTVTVQLKGYQDGWGTQTDGMISKIIAGNTNVTWISATVAITNNSEQPVYMGNTIEDLLKTLTGMVVGGDYTKIDRIKNEDFDVYTDRGSRVYHGDVGYQSDGTGMTNFSRDKLEPGKTGYVKLFCITPSNWKTMSIKYSPSFAKGQSTTFRLTRDTDIIK